MFYTQELLMVLFTIIMIGQQYYATWAYRKYALPRTKQVQWLHKFNWLLLVFTSVMLSLKLHGWEMWYLILCNLFVYSTFFDAGYSLTITNFKNAWYLGGDAKSDEEFKQLLGKNEGKTKFFVELGFLIALNLAYKLLLK